MSATTAANSGQFSIGKYKINRLGYGAMRITGDGVWGKPNDPKAAADTLKRLPELGVNFVDTADAYGPFVSEVMIREQLKPYKGMLIATKGGLVRHGPNVWLPLGRPEYLRQCVLMSIRRLGVKKIGLWQLHRIDPRVPRKEQFEVIRDMQKEGLIDHVGLSEVSIDDIKFAQKFFKVATVQNKYNLIDRTSEDVLDFCTTAKIGFIPWFPLAAGALAKPGSALTEIAGKIGATPGQVALAWVLKRSPVMLPIPGTSNAGHLEENVAAANVELSDADFDALDKQGKAEFKKSA